MEARELQEKFAAFRAGQAPAASVYRALVAYDGWVVPAFAGPEGLCVALTRTASGEQWVEAFTDRATLEASAFVRTPTATMRIDGTALVNLLRDDLAGINLDPGTPRSLHFKVNQFAFLREWVASVEVEGLLHGADDDFGLHKFRDFPAYRMVVRELPQGLALVLAPDDRGRKLAAVFTAPDCVDAFIAAMKEKGVQGMKVLRQDGTHLFEELAGQRLDGIVFNPAGPAKPKGMQLAFAATVLKATS